FYRGKNRQDILKTLKPYDLIICSYGLLPQDADFIGDVKWTTALLDEAQAIKNIGTKRTKAAWNLTADFKLITTGTPIENHLGELWSLFRYLNPGLLGTQDHFTRMFMAPIERFKDKNASHNLRQLIQPFILRRLKSQVLQELPPRTEITHSVPLSKEERALYEAVRQKAITKFVKNDRETDANTNPIQILAEITKLRLASCHPRLVMENSPLPGSKLQAFGEILEELLDNNHKALVFSQFVKHLSILREYLDEQGISYQYLDGSTPQTKRKQAVDAFQDGKGDVFLISLKAGGSGLNLTAADYVIHMDPWWNPAVEDQASDRAHRIGQQRPVTIYRLVAENTIEEKIVKLHQRKRDLADNLLEGTDISGKMNAGEMLRLIQDA
ncbi:MAG: DEAD/DEAH box helicase, partial [Thiotrichaceae bacterium]